jgi:uncharacterized protein YbjT (DUF2867 family)
MILVAGATGLVGHEVCRKLAVRGEKVRALVRRSSSPERLAGLREVGAELFIGDLKDPDSLKSACQGVDAIVSTASSTLSRQAGDSIESVDLGGQMNLQNAAKLANVSRFVFVSFRRPPGISSPLADAKAAVERVVADLNFTIIQASWFMEVWLSPTLGFDYLNASARLYGPGTSPVSWVSYRDVAEMCATALAHPAAERRIIEFGGPKALSPLDVVARFEKISGRSFYVEHVPESALRAQYETATDSMQKSFAALMLGYSSGDAIEMSSTITEFGLKLTSVDDYARAVLGKA